MASKIKTPPPAEINRLAALLNTGHHAELENSARTLLTVYPSAGIVWKLLSISLHMQGKVPLMALQKAAGFLPDDAGVHSNLGNALHDLGRFEEAVASYRRALKIKPDLAMTHYNLGIALQAIGQSGDAVISYRHALELNPNYAAAHNNLGNALLDVGQIGDAVASYRRALELNPNYAEAHSNLGNAMKEQGQFDAALACYRRALEIDPGYAEAYINLSVIQQDLRQFEDALTSCRRAVELKPANANAHNSLGCVLKDIGQFEAALTSYRRALEIMPGNANAHYNMGIVYSETQRYDEAASSYRHALAIKPDFPFALGMLLHSKMYSCDWEGLENILQKISDGINAGKPVSMPFILMASATSLAQQRRCAEIFVQKKHPEILMSSSGSGSGRNANDKIRLGYFSADFHNHATAYLMAELLERHDRNKFEVTGFSFGPSLNDQMRTRIVAAFDRFIDVRNLSDQDIAALARNHHIDIAIDLKGYTTDSRAGIFARRPAPVQLSYLGYPGTMGSPYIDYLIADPTIIPVEHQQYYSEKIAYLPDTYQVNDTRRKISERQFKRSEAGLPDDGFVFCCFNNNFKITPVIFDIWMQLLKQVEGSVLWLLQGNELVMQNLHDEAKKRGIAPERLVFAQRMDLPEHLARHRLADLFLDTFFCNAHTTASDALWAGLPVLTCLGETFAGRVAASLLNAIGLHELITHSYEEYKVLALKLATNPEKLAMIRRQLDKNKITHPLFNTSLFTRHIEDVYIQMWEKHQLSLPPDHIYVRRKNE